MTNSSLALRVVNYTNERLKKWYNTVFEDFGVAHNGMQLPAEGDLITIKFQLCTKIH